MQSEPVSSGDRARALVAVAERHATGIDLRDLSDLLPNGAGSELVGRIGGPDPGWTHAHGRLFGNPELAARHDPARADRGARYLRVATRFFDGPLAPVAGLVRTAGVTGSVAFGEPEAGDDLDFMVVTRRGAVWPFLLFTYLAVRRRAGRTAEPDGPSAWCFNYVLDEDAAEQDFSRPHGFQFAREALSVQPVVGPAYYAGLLERAPWMRSEAPGFYERWMARRSTAAASGRPRPAPALIRLMNRLLHPVMAAYLQMVALRDNHRLRREGRGDREFEVITRADRVELRSLRFAELAAIYEQGRPR